MSVKLKGEYRKCDVCDRELNPQDAYEVRGFIHIPGDHVSNCFGRDPFYAPLGGRIHPEFKADPEGYDICSECLVKLKGLVSLVGKKRRWWQR